MFEKINKFDESILLKEKKYLIAVSGGVDSMTLLYNMFYLGYKIEVLIIDHQLRETSELEALESKKNINLINESIKTEIIKWDHDEISSSVEEKARNFRYKAFVSFANSNQINGGICVGHNKNDQIETFFLNLSRGSGLDGLSCIPKSRIEKNILILRPMLDISKKEIIEYALRNNIKWIEDPTNKEDKFTRNKIRNLLSSLNPSEEIFNERVLNSINLIQKGNELLKKYIIEKFYKISIIEDKKILIKNDDFLKLTEYEKFFIVDKIIKNFISEKQVRSEKILNIVNDLTNSQKVNREIANSIKIEKNNNIICFFLFNYL